MDPAQQKLSQDWQGYLQQVSGRFTQLMQQTDAGCRQLLQTRPDDVMATEQALSAVHTKVDELEQEVWDNRKQRNGPVEATHDLVRWIDESWDRAAVNWKWAAYKALWPYVQQLLERPVSCTQCGAPLTPGTRLEMDRVTCSGCGVVNETAPDPKVQLFYLGAPDLWARASTFDQRLAADRQKKSAAKDPAGAEELLQWEKTERDYWTAYVAAKAQVLPASPEKQQKEVESRMEPVLDELSYRDAWREAKGMAPTVKRGGASSSAPGFDDWGPLRPDQVEEFFYQRDRLDNARNDPEGFQALLERFGYRDSAHFEQVQQTFKRHVDESDEGVARMESEAWQRAMQDNLVDKAQSEDLAPVEGVTLEEYADIATQQQQAPLSPAELEQLLAQHGMDMVKYNRVANGWNERIMQNRAVGIAYMKVFQAAQQRLAAASGFDASSYTIEQYCEMAGALNLWAEQGKDPNAMLKQEFNVTLQNYMEIGMVWVQKQITDENLSKRMAELTAAAKLKYMAR